MTSLYVQSAAMVFEWDERKNKRNLLKHGFAFQTATLVFDDPLYRSMKNSEVDGEERWSAIGLAGGVSLLLVVPTIREDQEEEVVRILSARKATRQERAFYEGQD